MILSLVIAVGAVSALILILFRNTTGPGQTLRRYYQAVAADDCSQAYASLSSPLHDAIPEDRLCTAVAAVKDRVPTSITILAVTGCGEPPADFARVIVHEHGPGASPQDVRWEMVREGDDWNVASFPTLRRLVRSQPPPATPRVPRACRIGSD